MSILIPTFVGAAGLIWFLLKAQATFEVVRSSEPSSWTEDQKAGCGIVLTGGRGRVREGFDLLYRHQIRKLIISGVHPQATVYELLPVWPYYGGLREADVILEKRSQTTYGNAQQSLPLVEALQCHDVILITSNLHMARAFKTFRSAFPAEIEIKSHSVVATRLRPSFMDTAMEVSKYLFYSLWAF